MKMRKNIFLTVILKTLTLTLLLMAALDYEGSLKTDACEYWSES
ncbi:MAG: hypothetical protein OEY24_03620 [Candidatus Bathyarchaeota archaeon]|nr:hypothetical protein [Candidatus Bathyarchaeota archaeon]MDH5494774.1 hypothetical protein [Candidatus Bathyarchaeota archaeon]